MLINDDPTDDANWFQYQAVWDTHPYHAGDTIPTGYLDGHAGKVNSGKFVSWLDNNGNYISRTQFYQDMTARNLWAFWGEFWTPTD